MSLLSCRIIWSTGSRVHKRYASPNTVIMVHWFCCLPCLTNYSLPRIFAYTSSVPNYKTFFGGSSCLFLVRIRNNKAELAMTDTQNLCWMWFSMQCPLQCTSSVFFITSILIYSTFLLDLNFFPMLNCLLKKEILIN